MKTPGNRSFGLYVHWPYCLTKCPYCNFFSRAEKKIDETALTCGYIRDLKQVPPRTEITSIFFGGGTPSLMPISMFETLMRHIRTHTCLSEDVEITVEANPDAITTKKMKEFKELGVNRLSVGVQALNESDLAFLGRHHSVKTALNCIENAQKMGFRVNMDLIYARPEQTLKQWEEELKIALSLGLGHYSLYQLTIEPDTVFGRKNISGADEETAALLFLNTLEIMEKAGCPAYEVSNFARPNEECRHNLTYWLGYDYVGIGPSAHGRLGLNATVAPAGISQWLQNGIESQLLTPEERFEERLLMAMRLPNRLFPIKGLNAQGVHRAIENGWLSVTDTSICPTKQGLLFSNTLALWVCP